MNPKQISEDALEVKYEIWMTWKANLPKVGPLLQYGTIHDILKIELLKKFDSLIVNDT